MIKDLAMQRVIKWLLFGVVCGLLPIGFVALDFVTVGEHFRIRDLIGKGELLLISCGIVTTGLGELLVEGTKYSNVSMFLAASSLILVGICWLVYYKDYFYVGRLKLSSPRPLCQYKLFKKMKNRGRLGIGFAAEP